MAASSERPIMSKKPAKSSSRSTERRAAAAPRPAVAKRLPAKLSGPDTTTLARVANALERIAAGLPAPAAAADNARAFAAADAFVWHPSGRLIPVPRVSRVEIALLKGIDRMRDTLIENTQRFATGLPANNALLWGARGMGKSSLVKAACRHQRAAGCGWPAEADRDSPRGHREPAATDADPARLRLPLHRVLRRPVVRRQ
jgi:hypothetical protein